MLEIDLKKIVPLKDNYYSDYAFIDLFFFSSTLFW